ncbi:MAG: MFS transporter [Alphaproteobacteria bacterium]
MSDLRLVAALCLALVCATLSYTTYSALVPTFIAEWRINNTESGLISGAFFAGYVAAVPVLVSLTDRIDPRRILLASLALSALASAAFALVVDGFWSAVAFRLLGGVGLAGSYMPGMKALSDRLHGKAQARAVTFYAASFYLGVALSVLSAAWSTQALGWRAAFAANAAETLVALAIVFATLPKAASRPRRAAPGHPFDFRPVIRNRRAMAYVVGYAAHNWEVIGFHAWVVAFLTFSAGLEPGRGGPWSPEEIVTLVLFASVPAAIFGNEIAQRFGRRRTLIALMTASAGLALALGFGAALPFSAVVALTGLYAVSTAADSGGLSAGTVAAAEPDRMGATMAMHSTLGFLAGMLGPVAFGWLLDATGGGATVASWGTAFAGLALGVMVGPLTLALLGRDKPATAGAAAMAPRAPRASKK